MWTNLCYCRNLPIKANLKSRFTFYHYYKYYFRGIVAKPMRKEKTPKIKMMRIFVSSRFMMIESIRRKIDKD